MFLITPLDIQNKEFGKSFRGYNIREVDEFLDRVIEDYEKLYKENIEFKDKISSLANQLEQYNTLEKTLKDTLVVAQTTADDVIANSRNKAKNIVEDAEIQRNKIIEMANNDVRNIKNEYKNLKEEIFIFKTRYQSFIEAQLMSLEEFHERIEGNDAIRKKDQVEEKNEIGKDSRSKERTRKI